MDTTRTEEREQFEHVSVLQYTPAADEYDQTPGEKVVVGGVQRNLHVMDDGDEDFVKIADGVAIIELHQPVHEDNVTEWCNSPAGKLALAHWFDHTDPDEVAMS